MKTLPLDFLQECFSYDSETGLLIWKSRPRHHFHSDRGYRQTNGKYAGRVAGTLSSTTGYIVVNFRGDLYGAHRIIFALMFGVWVDQIDHIDGSRSNNRQENLRACSRSDNLCNRGKQSNNTSGFKGVYLSAGKWMATITRHRKTRRLGPFGTPEEAHNAYANAAIALHGRFANIGN